ncbi:MAG: DUF3137 domain-containing protein [Bacteroidales bacterium]|nr:DUF3137 domain-containing protein [Bacteroidales bacterium]
MQIPKEKLDRLEQTIQGSIEKLEARRAADKKKSRNIAIVLTVIVLVLVLVNGKGNLAEPIGCTLFLGGLAYFMINTFFKSRHNKTYKAEVVPELVETIIPGATYSAKGLIKKQMLKDAKLYKFNKGKTLSSEDTIEGRIGKTDFMFSEVVISHSEDDGNGGTDTIIDLKGFVFIADFNKYFKGHTVLSSHKSHLDIGMFSSYNRCVLEDIDFEKRYTTYTTDDQQARYIITPGLQHRIMELHSFFDNNEMAISFLGDQMMILLNSGTDHFEVKYDMQSVMNDLYALSLLGDIVEQLNLDLRIWSKE